MVHIKPILQDALIKFNRTSSAAVPEGKQQGLDKEMQKKIQQKRSEDFRQKIPSSEASLECKGNLDMLRTMPRLDGERLSKTQLLAIS